MNRGTIFVALFVIIAAGIIGASRFLEERPPVEIVIGADPLVEDWLRAVLVDFNGSEARLTDGRTIRVSLQVADDIEVWRDRIWTSQNHPDGWIPAVSASIKYAQDSNVPFQLVADSVAQTPLMFGAFSSRASVLNPAGLDWDDIQRAAEAEAWSAVGGEDSWRFVNLAFALPDETMVGLGTLLSGVASFTGSETLTGSQIQDRATRTWLEPIALSVPNFNNVGADAALFMVRAGTASVDIATATESQWLSSLSGLISGEGVEFSYPEYLVVFDFPVSVWDDSSTLNEEREAINIFADWLRGDVPQEALLTYGLRPVDGVVPVDAALFAGGEEYGVMLDLPGGSRVSFPSRSSDVLSLLSVFNTVRN